MSEKQQRLVLSIIEFLNQSIEDGTVKQDDKESLEVAIQCIGEAFGVDPNDEQQSKRLSIKPATLKNVFDVFLKTRDRLNTSGSPPASTTAVPPPAAAGPSAEDKAEAEKLKAKGNQLMTAKDYAGAIDAYTQAIARDGTNAVYYSNRAAAYSSKGDHASAISDAENAIEADPAFSKAYHRLGHAHYSLGDYSAAASAFRQGLDVDPNNAGLNSGLQNAEARTSETSARSPGASAADTDADAGAGAGAGPGMGGLADLLGGMGGGRGGGGGMPDITSMMQNPMLMQMAQQMAANGGLERMMSNPSVANMMNRVQSGGGMPSMQEIMSDPALREMAGQFMGGAGRGGPPAGSV